MESKKKHKRKDKNMSTEGLGDLSLPKKKLKHKTKIETVVSGFVKLEDDIVTSTNLPCNADGNINTIIMQNGTGSRNDASGNLHTTLKRKKKNTPTSTQNQINLFTETSSNEHKHKRKVEDLSTNGNGLVKVVNLTDYIDDNCTVTLGDEGRDNDVAFLEEIDVSDDDDQTPVNSENAASCVHIYPGGEEERSKVSRRLLRRLKQAQKISREEIRADSGYSPFHEIAGRYHKLKSNLIKEGYKCNLGPWKESDLCQLNNNVNTFVKENSIKCKYFKYLLRDNSYEIWKWRRESNFYYLMCHGILRTLGDVQIKLQRMYGGYRWGHYSDVERKSILVMRNKGKSWISIGNHLNRHRVDIQLRYAEMKIKKTVGHWSDEEINKLTQAVRYLTETGENDIVFKNISWKSVAKIVGTRTNIQCQGKWLKLVFKSRSFQNGVGDTVDLNWKEEETKCLVDFIYQSGADDLYSVDFEPFTKQMDVPKHPLWLRWKWNKIVREKVPKYNLLQFEEIVDYLADMYLFAT